MPKITATSQTANAFTVGARVECSVFQEPVIPENTTKQIAAKTIFYGNGAVTSVKKIVGSTDYDVAVSVVIDSAHFHEIPRVRWTTLSMDLVEDLKPRRG